LVVPLVVAMADCLVALKADMTVDWSVAVSADTLAEWMVVLMVGLTAAVRAD
jgi:hypothetical protein